MFPSLWSGAERYNIDPVGLVAQSYKETGAGNFPGRVKPEFYNTCGLKNRVLGLFPGVDDGDNPLAHARFASWEAGARAHAQHVRAYTGWPVRDDLVIDPRYWLVSGQKCEDWADLSGKWAPSATYGQEIEALMVRLG
jgi:N-acetylmuramoyl-L-alanine amidase